MLRSSCRFCNYVNVEWMIMKHGVAFFGKGIGALGWAVMADTAPKDQRSFRRLTF